MKWLGFSSSWLSNNGEHSDRLQDHWLDRNDPHSLPTDLLLTESHRQDIHIETNFTYPDRHIIIVWEDLTLLDRATRRRDGNQDVAIDDMEMVETKLCEERLAEALKTQQKIKLPQTQAKLNHTMIQHMDGQQENVKPQQLQV